VHDRDPVEPAGAARRPEVSATLAAVADPVRRAVIQRLAHGPATTGQLAELFPISRAAVSQHLRVLKEAGLVRLGSASRRSPYELAAAPLIDLEEWVSQLIDIWAAGPTARTGRDHARRRAAR
jgi:DNA-binding transcriptional ArsR family regulator